jgi:hypothetical protein
MAKNWAGIGSEKNVQQCWSQIVLTMREFSHRSRNRRSSRTKLTNKPLGFNHFSAWYSQTALVCVAPAKG